MCRQLQIFEKSTVPYVMASGRINAINVRYLHDRCSSPSTHRWQQTRLAFSQKPSIASRTTRSEIGVQVENQMGGQGKDVGPDSLHLIQSSSMEWIPFLMCPVNDPTRLAFELRCSTSQNVLSREFYNFCRHHENGFVHNQWTLDRGRSLPLPQIQGRSFPQGAIGPQRFNLLAEILV